MLPLSRLLELFKLYSEKLLYFLLQKSGPIKEKDGRVRHFKGLGEEVQQETSVGKMVHVICEMIKIIL